MKTNKLLLTCLGIFIAGGPVLKAQGTFDPELYKQYLEDNKSLTSSQLISDNPAKTTYYATRTNPAEPNLIPWFDSINRVFSFTAAEKDLLKKDCY